jgi:hypothetical protein
LTRTAPLGHALFSFCAQLAFFRIASMPLPPRARKTLVVAAKVLVLAAVVWGIERTLRAALGDLRRHEWSPASMKPGWLVAAAILYAAGQLPSSLFWHRLLRLFDQPVTPLAAVRSWYVGSLGKYVPGKAMVIVLRTGLLRRQHVGIAVATATIFYETLTTMAVGALVSGALLLVLVRDRPTLVALAVGLMLAAGAPTIPAIFKRLARLAGIERAAPALIDRLDHLGFRTLLCCSSCWRPR